MQIVHELDPLRRAVAGLRTRGQVALVPTMGALHEGHLSLVRVARERAAAVVASIFVNPLQFGPNEDLAAYPRQFAQDCALLEAAGCDLVWNPDVATMYPDGFASTVSVAGVSEGLCGAARPGHFDGVATVVCKLFNQVGPDHAVFGEKDWQQLAVIRRMARDFDLAYPAAAAIHAAPTMREADGLAMSSRNAYLTPDERRSAAALPSSMRAAIAGIVAGAPVPDALSTLRADLSNAGFGPIDYAELRDAKTLTALGEIDGVPARLFVAARIGKTRLIDNMPVERHPQTS